MADTIAAIATGTGVSAIGILRLSGDGAIDAADAVFNAYGGVSMKDAPDRKLCYGELHGVDGGVIDICLCTVSRGPNSYTGEDTAEFQCHGSPVVLAEGLKALFAKGARQATRGEFTKRAFLNGRMDLSQAEAVVDLIDSETAEAAKNAVGQLSGVMGEKFRAIYSGLTDIMAHFHAVIDYPDEDIEDFQLSAYKNDLESYGEALKKMLATFDRGKILRFGVKSAIIGCPNAGKSSLLNALLGYERAIVTDIPGTTRDTIEERVRFGDVLLALSDTAGMRDTDDTVERMGVERAVSAAEGAQLVLAVFDGSRPLTEEDMRVLGQAQKAPCAIAVINKSDLPQVIDVSAISEKLPRAVNLSAKTGEGMDSLELAVKDMFGGQAPAVQGELITNARHADAAKRALESITSAVSALDSGITPDAVLTEVESAMSAIGEVTGATVREDVTDRIFERFCVGK
ncbi:MAG: tRNA uridine-5-carboxymethylaminomethyl(34) synthesis GTPase MnmE [Oscillospiraceae bacterium]|nr:tRNA uridine-5-carboxymethylaminomethyl(34) synthesis GTPase MnmE [Oscillospiraceae bacterium]